VFACVSGDVNIYFENSAFEAPYVSRLLITGQEMIIGMLLMIVGAVLLTRNRNLAELFVREPHAHQWHFTTSIARQNFAIMGAVFLVGGLVFFFLF
jgi:hypothetical protein